MRQRAEETLKEAFPTIDASVVKAVLVASGWNVERAFHALLGSKLQSRLYIIIHRWLTFCLTGMTDPSAQQDEMPPPKPPRPAQTQRQLEADELYAHQLAEHYNSLPRRHYNDESRYWRPGDDGVEYGDYPEDKEYSFFDGTSFFYSLSPVHFC